MCLAVAGVIVAITDNHPLRRTARVLFGSIEREINISFVPEVVEGDWILVHAGVAICSAFRDRQDPQFDQAREGE
jgi:hydrogenase expression/formation protein HypC